MASANCYLPSFLPAWIFPCLHLSHLLVFREHSVFRCIWRKHLGTLWLEHWMKGKHRARGGLVWLSPRKRSPDSKPHWIECSPFRPWNCTESQLPAHFRSLFLRCITSAKNSFPGLRGEKNSHAVLSYRLLRGGHFTLHWPGYASCSVIFPPSSPSQASSHLSLLHACLLLGASGRCLLLGETWGYSSSLCQEHTDPAVLQAVFICFLIGSFIHSLTHSSVDPIRIKQTLISQTMR